MNAIEQTMSLMDTWLNKADWTILGERDNFGSKLQSDTYSIFYRLLRPVSEHPADEANDFPIHILYRYEIRVAAALLEQFGCIKVTYATEAEEGKVADIETIDTTDFGMAIFDLLNEIVDDSREDELTFEEKLKPYLPDWKNSLILNQPSFRDGTYVLKMSWQKVWRRLVAPATTTLEEVTNRLLSSFAFDNDHLYELTYRERSGKVITVSDPRHGEGDYFADEIKLGDLPLDAGDHFELLFDFGDCWKFSIMIENIEGSNTKQFKPKITHKHGKAPRKYDFGDAGW